MPVSGLTHQVHTFVYRVSYSLHENVTVFVTYSQELDMLFSLPFFTFHTELRLQKKTANHADCHSK